MESFVAPVVLAPREDLLASFCPPSKGVLRQLGSSSPHGSSEIGAPLLLLQLLQCRQMRHGDMARSTENAAGGPVSRQNVT